MNPLLIYTAVVVTLALLVSVVDLVVDLKAARPVRRRNAITQAAEHGAAYAEQFARKKEMPAHEKFQHALHCARGELQAMKVKFTDAELGRAIEVAVSKLTVTPAPPPG